MSKSAQRKRRTSRTPKPNIETNPTGAVLILPTIPGDGTSAIAVLLKPDGSAIALRGLTEDDGRWKLPSLTGEPAAPAEARAALHALRDLRNGAEAEVERLIALLDEIDGDTDREPQGDEEPSQGTQERHGRGWSLPSFCGDEAEDDDEGEPSLGATETLRQTAWGCGGRRDLEDEHDGREPDADGEPSLGALEPLEPEKGAKAEWLGRMVRLTKEDREGVYDQSSWARGDDRDLEVDEVVEAVQS